jgi:hypothetical protein
MAHRGETCDLPLSWDERLAAIQDYYGSPGPVMPFHFLNPGAYISNVTFWLKALDDYQHGNVRAHPTGPAWLAMPPLQDTLRL